MMDTTTLEILQQITDDFVSHGIVEQTIKDSKRTDSVSNDVLCATLQEILQTGRVEIGHLSLGDCQKLEFTAWVGTIEDRVARAVKLHESAVGADKEFAYWLCLTENADRFEE